VNLDAIIPWNIFGRFFVNYLTIHPILVKLVV